MSEKEKTFLDSAMKHHSSAQAAIKSLQEQLEYLEELRKSAKESSILKEEKELEKSTTDLLSSTHRYLLDSPGNNRNKYFPALSSTVNNFESVKDHENLTQPVSPIKSLYIGNLTKDSLASTALHLSPTTTSHLSTTIMSGATSVKNSLTSPLKSVAASSSHGSMNLTDILSRLVYGGTVADESENGNKSGDELLAVLDKITRVGQQLQAELQNAKQREAKLINEIQHRRSKTNGFSLHHHPCDQNVSVGDADVEMKCQKLENAMLSLQEENVKLNRLLKDRGNLEPQDDEIKEIRRNLAAVQSENRLLQATVERMKAQLAYYEERHTRCTNSAEILPASVINLNSSSVNQDAVNDEKQKLEEKIQRLEKELNATRSSMTDNQHLQARIDEIHANMLKKNNYINQCESDLQSARIENKELLDKYETLQQKDVYKRKEVLLLCDKFESMKEKYLKLENEVLSLRKKDKDQLGNAEQSLRKFIKENEALHCRLIAEQREMSLSKSLLEKDYNSIKHRYDKLLTRLSRLDSAAQKKVLKKNEENVKASSHLAPKLPCGCQLLTHKAATEKLPLTAEDALVIPEKCPQSDKSIQSNIHRRRHFTSPSNRSSSDFHPGHFSRKSKSPTPLSSISPQPLSLIAPLSEHLVPPCSCGEANQIEIDDEIAVARHDMPVNPVNFKEDFHLDLAPSSHAYEKEYARSMGVSLRSKSCDQLDDGRLREKDLINSLQSRSEILSSTSPHRIRFHPTACTLPFSHISPAATETPYTREYLSNMDGVRLLVSLDNNGNSQKPGESSNRFSDENPRNNLTYTLDSFPKSITDELASPYDSALAKDFSKASFTKPSIGDVTAATVPSLLTTNTQYNVSDSDSSTTKESLHLSDLPCDQATVVDKFRNFDDYKRPPPVVQIGDNYRLRSHLKKNPDLRKKVMTVTSSGDRNSEKRDIRKQAKVSMDEVNLKPTCINQVKPSVISYREESDWVDQSSASTTRDHVGRIEFLRDIQINSGMRLHGLVGDASIQDRVTLNESDLNGEIRLGLSNNQEAYAERLVSKYTKNVGKILTPA